MKELCPGWYHSVARASAHVPKGLWFDSPDQGHVPGLQGHPQARLGLLEATD